jgi:pimeloyl-ACP methyl ester carboxylesterase
MTVTALALTTTSCSIQTSSASNTADVRPNAAQAERAPARAPAASREVAGTSPGGELAFLGPVRQVDAGGITVGYRQFGSGPPVVLVVGQGSTMAMWGTELPRRLALHHQVTMYDLRGVGLTTDPATQPLTIGQMGDDLAAFIDALGLRRPTVVGWSTGGEIALSLATSHPGTAGALVLSGATAGGPPAVQPDQVTDAAYRSGDLNQLLDLSFTASGTERRSAYVQQVLEAADTCPGEDTLFPSDEVDQRQNEAEAAFAADTRVYEALSRLDVPTVVTNGEADRLVPVANAELIARRIPNAQLRVYRDSAHVNWFQHIDRFVSDIELTAKSA